MSIAVMLATLTDRRDFGDGWLLERKFDGERCVVRREAMWSGSSRAPVRI
jgi:ATP-dependent DNA ligase